MGIRLRDVRNPVTEGWPVIPEALDLIWSPGKKNLAENESAPGMCSKRKEGEEDRWKTLQSS